MGRSRVCKAFGGAGCGGLGAGDTAKSETGAESFRVEMQGSAGVEAEEK